MYASKKILDYRKKENHFNGCLFTYGGRSQHCVKSVQIRSFFWSVFSCIRTEYGDLRCKYPYSVRIQKIKDQKKLRIWTLFTQCR